jgi:hypothetical protein
MNARALIADVSWTSARTVAANEIQAHGPELQDAAYTDVQPPQSSCTRSLSVRPLESHRGRRTGSTADHAA